MIKSISVRILMGAPMLDLDLLRSFVSVVDTGGFTRAGEPADPAPGGEPGLSAAAPERQAGDSHRAGRAPRLLRAPAAGAGAGGARGARAPRQRRRGAARHPRGLRR